MDRISADHHENAGNFADGETFRMPVIREQDLSVPQYWAALPQIAPDLQRLALQRIKVNAVDRAAKTWDVLRTRVAMVMQQNSWTSIAITSPTVGCGKTTVAMNLAMGLARQSNLRVVLIDLNLQRPRIAWLLGLERELTLEPLLSGHSTVDQNLVKWGKNLAIAASSHPVEGSAELLLHPSTKVAIADIKRRLEPDFIIVDVPAMLVGDDVMAALPMVDCALLVAAAGASNLGEIDICERDLVAQTKLVGVVLNKCKHGPERYGY